MRVSSIQGKRTGSRLGPWAVLGTAGCLAAASALRAIPGPDVSFLLYSAERIVQGARLGTDVVEINPPLIVWLSTIPVVLGELSGVSSHTLLVLLILAAIGVSLALTHSILEFDPHRTWLAAAAGLGLLLLPQLEFGQREQITAILTLPWVALAASRAEGIVPPARYVLCAAVLGSLGFLLKPYFLIAWVGLEITLALRTHRHALRRIENVVLFTFAIVYFAATLLLMPNFLGLTRILGPAYSVYQTQGELEALAAGLGVAIFFWYRARTGLPDSSLLMFEVAAAGFLLAAVVQLKWWPYHFIPAISYALPPLLLGFARNARSSRIRLRTSMLMPLVGVYLVVSSAAANLSILVSPRAQANLAEPFLFDMAARIQAHAPSNPQVLAFSTNIQTAFPLVPFSGAHWSLRLPSLWPLSAAYVEQVRQGGPIRTRPLGQRTALERWLTDAVLQDMRRNPPDLIFVMKFDSLLNDSGGARRFDYLEYFNADPRFAEMFANYKRDADVGRYQVYRRSCQTQAACSPQ